MAKLAFVPLDGRLIPTPFGQTIDNQQPKRICARVRDDRWVFIGAPHEVEDKTPAAEGMIRLLDRGEVAPANADTARALGVPFRPLEFMGESAGWRIAPQQFRTPTVPKSRGDAVKE